MEKTYSISDVVSSYQWLGHQGHTELNALDTRRSGHPLQSHAVIRYCDSVDGVVEFVEKHAGTLMVCYSLNPRPKVLRNRYGHPRAAKEADVEIVQNMLLDIDIPEDGLGGRRSRQLATLMAESGDFYTDLELRRPIAAFTGRGFHLLTALPPTPVSQVPDIANRQREFRQRFTTELKHYLGALGARVDDTQDLRRMVRVYGTAKPEIGILSSFSESKRIEDEAMRDYLVRLDLEQGPRDRDAPTPSSLPRLFCSLLERDQELRNLWHGRGKREGTDTSRSGYDYSLVSRLLWLGYTDLDELACVLRVRPDGAVNGSGKREAYVQRTIGSAIAKRHG